MLLSAVADPGGGGGGGGGGGCTEVASVLEVTEQNKQTVNHWSVSQ